MPEARALAGEPLAAGLAALGIDLEPEQCRRLLAYRDELARWNRVHNLSGVCDPEAMIPLHLFDSLALLPLVAGPRLADVGSGGGLPGVPLAIARPELAVLLIEPRRKRANFLQHIGRTLALDNVKVLRNRAEALPADTQAETVVARAFGSLNEFIAAAARLRAPGGCLLAAKGREPRAEIAELVPGWQAETIPLSVPGVDGHRHVVRLRPAG